MTFLSLFCARSVSMQRFVVTMVDSLTLTTSSLAKGSLLLYALVIICVRFLRSNSTEKSKLTDINNRLLRMYSITSSYILCGMYQDHFGPEQVLYHLGITQLTVSDTFGCGNYSRSMAKGSELRLI